MAERHGIETAVGLRVRASRGTGPGCCCRRRPSIVGRRRNVSKGRLVVGRLDHADADADAHSNANTDAERRHLHGLTAWLRRTGQRMVVMVMVMAGHLMMAGHVVVVVVMVDGRVGMMVSVVVLLLLRRRWRWQAGGQLVQLG